MSSQNNNEKDVYVCTIRNKWITSSAENLDDFIDKYQDLADEIREWKRLGVQLDPESGIGDDYAEFFTDNKEVAINAGFIHSDCAGNKLLRTRTGKEVLI